MTTGASFPAVSQGASSREVVERINRVMQGKLNAVTTVTLAANVTTTTLTDSRIGANSYLGFSPRSANAAVATGNLWVSAKTKGSATLTHANTATTDRTFDVLVIG